MRNLRTIAFLVLVIAANGVWAQDWPQWRGPNRDNKVVGFAVPKDWPKDLTKKWSVKVGIGESSPVLLGDNLYVFSRQGSDEVTLCLDAATGKEIWKDKYEAKAVSGPASPYPGTRSTPAVGAGRVCTVGVNGEVSCVDAATGKLAWRKTTKKPGFYTSTSPMIVDGLCIVFGESLFAYDTKDGKLEWTGPGGGAPYGSPVLMTVDGVKMVVTPTGSNNLVGVSLADGKKLWEVALEGERYFPNYSTPLINGDVVYYSVTAPGGGKGGKGGKGKGEGNFISVKVAKKGDQFAATELWKKPFSAAGYHTPLYRDGLIFGVSRARMFFCLDAKTGNELWQDKTARGNCGSILDAGLVLLSLTSDSKLVIFQPSSKAYTEVTKYTVSDSETWSVPIIAGNRIYVKDKGGLLTLWTLD